MLDKVVVVSDLVELGKQLWFVSFVEGLQPLERPPLAAQICPRSELELELGLLWVRPCMLSLPSCLEML